MKYALRLVLTVLPLFFYCAGTHPAQTFKPVEPDQELRGIWITRFDWARQDPQQLQNRIEEILQGSKKLGFNAVFFQVRGQAETLYPSPLEPWSEIFKNSTPHFDPVAFAVRRSHELGLEFHAYVNLLPVWNGKNAPLNPEHLYHRHGPQAIADSCWLCFDKNGRPMELNEYYYLNPALPHVKSYLKSVIRHLVSTYDIDGLHFDRIRYPGVDYTHDPYSNRQYAQDSTWTGLSRSAWARQQLTSLVEDVVAEALLIKPYLQISCASWGMYKTDDVPGYERFNDGYHAYHQDALLWLERGLMDFIVPMIYWDLQDPKPNTQEVWLDFKKRSPLFHRIIPGLNAKKEWVSGGELIKQIQALRQHGSNGQLLFSYSGVASAGIDNSPFTGAFTHPASLPPALKREKARRPLAVQSAPDQAIAFRPANRTNQDSCFVQRTDDHGWAGFVLPAGMTSLQLQSPIDKYLNLNAFQSPLRFCLSAQGNIERSRPWLEVRQAPADTTTQTTFHLLCKTIADAKAYINSDSCHVYKTGIFFNALHLQRGINRYAVCVQSKDSTDLTYVKQVFVKPPAAPRGDRTMWIDSTSIEPHDDLWLTALDKIVVRCKGAPGRQIFAGFAGQKTEQRLQRTDHDEYAVYEGELAAARLAPDKEHHLILTIKDQQGRIESKRVLPAKIRISDPNAFPLLRTRRDKTGMSYNLGPIRLGGPLVAEYPAGVILQSSGRFGHQMRIRLNASDQGFVAAADVEELAGETVRPAYYITSISAGPSRNSDVVSIPYPESVPYAIRPEPELSRIRLILYGVKTSSTWITHRQGLKMIDRVTWQQTDPETYEVLVYLHSKKIWGYDLQKKSRSLELQIVYPPPLSVQADTVRLNGLVLAIEAGHGGSNTGALGLSGLEEKTVNLQVAQELERLCQSRGIQVVQVRPEDRDMSLEEKQTLIETSNAHLAVSIHANAASTQNGFLGANGTSVYYNNPFWAEFAEKVYVRLLQLPLKEFGAVGHFNYRVIRIASRPTVLVEQAFMTHAGDEEKLYDPEFRRHLAEKILQGVIDYISCMFEKPVR